MLPWRWADRWSGFGINLVAGLLILANSLIYALWRPRHPPTDPGGPLGVMGEPYVTWSWLSQITALLGVFCWLQVAVFLSRRFTARYGRPPELVGPVSAPTRSDAFGLLLALPLVGAIAVYIALRPAAGPFGGITILLLSFVALGAVFLMVPDVQRELFRWVVWLRTRPWNRPIAATSPVPAPSERRPTEGIEDISKVIAGVRRTDDSGT